MNCHAERYRTYKTIQLSGHLMRGALLGLSFLLLALTGGCKGERSEVTPKASELTPRVVAEVGLGIYVSQTERGLTIDGILQGSPAAHAQLEPGDLILAVSGQRLANIDALAKIVTTHTSGTIAHIGLLRAEKEISVEVSFGLLFMLGDNDIRYTSKLSCDQSCRCTLRSTDAACSEVYSKLDPRPGGGINFEHTCTDYPRAFPGLNTPLTKSCGTVVLI